MEEQLYVGSKEGTSCTQIEMSSFPKDVWNMKRKFILGTVVVWGLKYSLLGLKTGWENDIVLRRKM